MKSRKNESRSFEDSNEMKSSSNNKISEMNRSNNIETYFWRVSTSAFWIIFFYVTYLKSEEVIAQNIFLRGVTEGWFFERRMDKSDAQWSSFRENIPFLVIGSFAFITTSNLIKKMFNKEDEKKPILIFYTIIGAGVTFYIHGFDLIFLYASSFLNYFLAKKLKTSKAAPILCWLLNLGLLFLADYYRGFRFVFKYLPYFFNKHGLFSWQIYFKLTILRHISFSLDYYWAMHDKKPANTLETASEYTRAQETNLPEREYNILQFLAYTYYVPLFIAGPIITFNAFASQVRNPQKTYSLKEIGIMLLRVAIYILGFEIWLHFMYQYSISQLAVWKSHNFESYQIALTGYMTLTFMYLKFLIIWRFFRTIGLLDGFDSPENMNRCVSNNYTFTGFWRSWHGSLNKWILRYLYLPLGGKKTQVISMWFIYSFVGLWHDLKWNWLAWAWLNCGFFSFEIIIMNIFQSNRLNWLTQKWYYRYFCAFAGASNVFLLMIANLAILYSFENSVAFIQRSFWKEGGFKALIGAYIYFFCAVNCMFDIREGERKRQQMKRF